MPATPSFDTHVLLDTHATHPSAVTAVLSGPQARILQVALEAANWVAVAENRLVLARIDREEPYWARVAAQRLEADGITVEITPRLQEAIDHAAEMRPGPAPLTETERDALAARSVFDVTATKSGPSRPEQETVPVYLADAGDHDALLDTFLDAHGEFEKWRTWSDDTTHAIHESQTLRIERVHEAPAHETAWTVAAYETPVSDRVWVLTATGATPAPVLQRLLTHLADGDGWDALIGATPKMKQIAAATQPLADAGWTYVLNGQGFRCTSPDGNAGVQFDPLTAQRPQKPATWTIWAGTGPDRPTWAITASSHTPEPLLAGLSESLAHDTGTRRPQPDHEHKARLAASALAVTAGRPASRSR
ncbi:DUF317 domain-containing protein [Streptomyces sp. NPDC092952]|uniref:DUF317 domain-containing protein n=1 Tax=Streptomyces sp. NPDC092952 TaxID=3366018 RepID=UPI0037F11539